MKSSAGNSKRRDDTKCFTPKNNYSTGITISQQSDPVLVSRNLITKPVNSIRVSSSFYQTNHHRAMRTNQVQDTGGGFGRRNPPAILAQYFGINHNH